MPINSALAFVLPEQNTHRHLGKDPGRTPHPGGGPQGQRPSPWAEVLSGLTCSTSPSPSRARL